MQCLEFICTPRAVFRKDYHNKVISGIVRLWCLFQKSARGAPCARNVCVCACCQVCSSFIPWDELKPLFWICLCCDPFVKKRATPFSCPFWHNYSRTMERPAGFTLLADVLLPLYVLEIDGHVLPLWMNVNTAISPRCLLPWWRGTQSWCHHTLSAACSCFSFFSSLLPLLSAFLFCCRRFQSNYLPSPFHKYLLHTHSYSSWVTRMQRFFPLIHFILLPLHIALVLSLAEESQVSYCSPLWHPSFTELSLLISPK